MLQNRVDPFGNLIRTPAKGHWLGNRGLLHNHQQEILRPFRLKAWITCLLAFKQRRRVVMSPGQYTELFFFDEATAFAAGHRPCFECRREDAIRFKESWLRGNPEYGFNSKTHIGAIDEILHAQRVSPSGIKLTYTAEFSTLPNGTFIEFNGDAHLLSGTLVYRWSPNGYEPGQSYLPMAAAEDAGIAGQVTVLTPRSTVNAFRAGYVPEMRLPLP
jgi:hypothetical protein